MMTTQHEYNPIDRRFRVPDLSEVQDAIDRLDFVEADYLLKQLQAHSLRLAANFADRRISLALISGDEVRARCLLEQAVAALAPIDSFEAERRRTAGEDQIVAYNKRYGS